MSHLPLDARAVLEYLNELGYRNISAEQLKEFLKDLRKLIKYEERIGINAHLTRDRFENLFRSTTASYRARYSKQQCKENEAKQRSDEANPRKSDEGKTVKKKQSTFQDKSQFSIKGQAAVQPMKPSDSKKEPSNVSLPNLEHLLTGNMQEVTDSKIQTASGQSIRAGANEATTSGSGQRSVAENRPQWKTIMSESEERLKGGGCTDPDGRTSQKDGRPMESGRLISARTSSSVMITRPRAPTRKPSASDPVALYQFYCNEWKHFRPHIPGENSHSDLRWQIRQKLLGPE